MRQLLSIPVLALLSLITPQQIQAVNIRANIGTGLDLIEHSNEASIVYSESDRYIGSDGKPINLA
jgi:hypothetical protein